MQMDWIDTFLDLIDSGSFHRSAERLGVGQSTVSARIKALEETVGARLLTRSRAGTRPTTAGLRFIPEARALRRVWQGACRQARGSGAQALTVPLGFQHDLVGDALGNWLLAFRSRLPETAVYVELDYSPQMCANIETGTLDFAVMFTPRPLPDLHFVGLGELRYQMMSTCAARLAEVTPDRYIRGNVAPAFAAAHRQALPGLEDAPLASGHAPAVASLLRAVGGSAYLPGAMAHRLQAEGVAQPVPDAPVLGQPVHAAMLLSQRTRRLQSVLLAIARSQFDMLNTSAQTP